MAVLRRAVFVAGYLYVGVGVVVCLVLAGTLALLPLSPETRERIFTRFIRNAAAVFVGLLRGGGALELDPGGLEELRRYPGAIVVANHPTFLDAVFVFAFLDRFFCVVKPTVMRNPLLSRSARAAGFVAADRVRALVAESSRRLAEGRSMVVFPEGTRTVGPTLHPFQPGFALIAVRSGAPVVTLHVTSGNGRWLQKGQPVVDLTPALPLRYRFDFGAVFRAEPGESAAAFLARVEEWFRVRHNAGRTAPVAATQ